LVIFEDFTHRYSKPERVMFPNHFRRIALASGLLDKQPAASPPMSAPPPAEPPRPAAAPTPPHASAARAPEPCKAGEAVA
jgi:hypothetical protein